jgi:hypothetical protein
MFDESSWFLSHFYARDFLRLSEVRVSPDQLLSSFGTGNAMQKINMEGILLLYLIVSCCMRGVMVALEIGT